MDELSYAGAGFAELLCVVPEDPDVAELANGFRCE